MSKYNEFETREEAEKWAAGVIAGLLSFGALATRISEIETEDKKIDTPEIESPDISVPSVNMNLGKNFGLSNIPADKLITIIFSLLMIIFIILSTIKGVKIKREDIVKDLLDGKFAFSFSVNGPTKFYLMSQGNKDFTLSGANEGNAKVIPGLVAPPFVDENSPYLHAKNNGMSGMVMNSYFLPSVDDVSIISQGVIDASAVHIDQISGYDLQVASFGETKTERVTVSDFVPEQLDDGTYGTFEIAPKRWYSNVVDGAFLLKYYNSNDSSNKEWNILSNEVYGRNVSYMIPVSGIDIEYRPLKIVNNQMYGIFKTITLETRDVNSNDNIIIKNTLYPEGEDCIVRFDADYDSLVWSGQKSSSIPRTIVFYGFYNDCNLATCDVEVSMGPITYLSKNIHAPIPAFDCGIEGQPFTFNGTSASGYTDTQSINKVHFGIVKRISGTVDENTSAYFQDIYNDTVQYDGEGYSDINGWFVVDNPNRYQAYTTEYETPSLPTTRTAYFSLGYTTVSFTADQTEKGKPVHKVQLLGLNKQNGNYYLNGMRCFYYDEYGKEKMWELKRTDGLYSPINLTPVQSAPSSSFRQSAYWYPLKSTSDFLVFSVNQIAYSSKIYDVIEGEDESEWPSVISSYRRMTVNNTSPKTTYEQQKTNDYIRAANVKGTSTIDVDYSVGVVDTNPHTDFNIASPCTVEVEVPDCYTDPPPQYSEGLDKARAELRCDEMYLIQIFGTDYMNLKTNDMSFAESYIPDCECGKTDRFFERY